MLEILILSTFVGTLGIEAVMASGWIRRQQVLAKELHREEDDILSLYDSKENYYMPVDSEPSNGIVQQVSKDPRLTGWEYKIVRASSDLFRNPAIFQNLCEEESQAGWILLEKLDDRRVRFKRPLGMREVIQTEQLSFDPYRSHYGPATSWMTWAGGFVAVVALVLPAYLGFALVSNTLANTRSSSPASPPPLPAAPSLTDPENSPLP